MHKFKIYPKRDKTGIPTGIQDGRDHYINNTYHSLC